MIQTFNKLEVNRNFFKLTKGFYEKCTASIMHIGERWTAFPSKIGAKATQSNRSVETQHGLIFACGGNGEWL